MKKKDDLIIDGNAVYEIDLKCQRKLLKEKVSKNEYHDDDIMKLILLLLFL